MKESLAIAERVFPANSPEVARRTAEVGNKLRNAGFHADAIEYRERALDLARKNNLETQPFFISILCNTALDYGSSGERERALSMLERCLAMRIARLGADHPENIATQNNIGAYAIALGDVDQAYDVLSSAFEQAGEALPEAAISRLAVEINYAITLWHRGHADQALPIMESVLARMMASFGDNSPPAKRARSILARLRLENGEPIIAKKLIEQSFGGLTPVWRADATLWAAEIALALGNMAEAETYANESLALRQSLKDFTPWQVAEAQWAFARATDDQALLTLASNEFLALPPNHFRFSQ